MKQPRFRIGDSVKPKPEWEGTPVVVPSGTVMAIVRFGIDGAIRVGTDPLFYGADVFDLVEVAT